eukprot:1451867-Pleurochrysis_carterae.AAC.1
MDEVSSVAREAVKDLQDEWGDHIPAPHCVLILLLLEGKPTMEEAQCLRRQTKMATRMGRGSRPVQVDLCNKVESPRGETTILNSLALQPSSSA